MKNAKFYYSPALQVRTFDVVCTPNGKPTEIAIGDRMGTFKRQLDRIAVCSIYDKETRTLSFGKSVCSHKDMFVKSRARSISYNRALHKPILTVVVPEGMKVSQVTKDFTHKIINGES